VSPTAADSPKRHSLSLRRKDSRGNDIHHHDPQTHPGLSARARAWLSNKFTLQCSCKIDDCEKCHHDKLVHHATAVSAGGTHAAHAHECDCVKHSLDTHDGDGYAFLGGYSM
jgi:hypothetical protein